MTLLKVKNFTVLSNWVKIGQKWSKRVILGDFSVFKIEKNTKKRPKNSETPPLWWFEIFE